MPSPVVTVFGSSSPRSGDEAYQIAFDLGRVLAEAGWTVCNGGYGGTMEAAARGAVEAGGHTIGVTCRGFGRSGANACVREQIETRTLFERLERLITLGQAYIVLPGVTGTLTELALTWELLSKGLLPAERPLILYGTYWQPVVDCVRRERPRVAEIVIATDLASVIDRLEVWHRAGSQDKY